MPTTVPSRNFADTDAPGARRATFARIAAIAITFACAGNWPAARADAPAAPATVDYAAIVASTVRTDDDRSADARRNPVELLKFAQVAPGMKVMDLSAGNGYTTQLLALAVGPGGSVAAQMGKMRPGFEKRLAAHPQANIRALVRPFTDPYPDDAPRLDLITFVLNYHDIANEPIDRAQMNAHLFAALRRGGHLVLIDHAAQDGSGLRDTKTLHRIDEKVVVDELQHAGFVVEARSDFLRNPADPRTKAFFDMDVPSDRFALRLVRP